MRWLPETVLRRVSPRPGEAVAVADGGADLFLAAVLFSACSRCRSSADGRAAPLQDAVFTATSAVTVTGLTSVDTAHSGPSSGRS
jgi:Trk-type K+ transport system membrane component